MLTLTGRHEFPYAVAELWDLLMNPDILRRSRPGCEELRVAEAGGRYAVRIRVGTGLLKGRFRGTLELDDLVVPETCSLTVSGFGVTGTVQGVTRVALEPLGAGGTTELVYDTEFAIEGALAAVSHRRLRAAAQAYLDAFFAAFSRS